MPEPGDEGHRAIRLQKLLAAAGLGSRRHCEDLIRQGRVAVDGQPVTELGTRVPASAPVTVDGRPIGRAEPKVYYALHKPAGYVSTARDPQGRPTVLDLVPSDSRVFPVGRLDYDSEGLIVLTNDGDLAQILLHPRHELEREYHVLVAGTVTADVLRRLSQGVVLDGRPTAPARVERLRADRDGLWLRFVIHEGRRRQVRRMCDAVGLTVRRLIRVRIGPLRLGDLPPGKSRRLTPREVEALRASARVAPSVVPRDTGRSDIPRRRRAGRNGGLQSG